MFRTLNYFWFDPESLEFKGFHLVNGNYQELAPNEQDQLWSQSLELYLGAHERKLRFFTPEGSLVPLPEEEECQRAEQERQRAEVAKAEVAEAELERLRKQLRSPDASG